MKFTLIAEDEPWFTSTVGNNATTKRTVEFKADSLIDIVAEFELFLKGSGYIFNHLEVFNESDDETNEFCESDPFFDDETAGTVWSIKTEKKSKGLLDIHQNTESKFQKKVK